MAHAIRVHAYGGPEVMRYDSVDVAAPAAGQAVVKHTAIGVNYIDTYHRTGLYPQPVLPFVPGMEGAGVVTAVGPGVTEVAVGDRVAYAQPIGSYATERVAPVDRLVKIPAGVSDKTAAAMMLQGMTVQYLIRRTYKVTPDTTLLWHAAAGGVGLIAMQWLKSIGATVIATAGSAEKCALAKAAGATHTINYRTEDWVKKVKELTGGQGCDVVYDSVGKDTYPSSLDCLKPLGLFVTFGNASGAIPSADFGILGAKGSLYVTRPTLMTYVAKRADLVATANDLFDVVAKGIVKININHEYALKDAVKAHADLEGRKTTGSIILTP
jgi:NADPH:quinone reductase